MAIIILGNLTSAPGYLFDQLAFASQHFSTLWAWATFPQLDLA